MKQKIAPCRPLSPRGRPLGNRANAGESPLSPLSPERSWGWVLHYPEREPQEVYILPEPTLEEVLAGHPDAIAAEPIPELERVAQPLSPGARAAPLVPRHYYCPGDELTLMREAARKAQADALICFRTIAEREGLLTELRWGRGRQNV